MGFAPWRREREGKKETAPGKRGREKILGTHRVRLCIGWFGSIKNVHHFRCKSCWTTILACYISYQSPMLSVLYSYVQPFYVTRFAFQERNVEVKSGWANERGTKLQRKIPTWAVNSECIMIDLPVLVQVNNVREYYLVIPCGLIDHNLTWSHKDGNVQSSATKTSHVPARCGEFPLRTRARALPC